MVRPPLTPAQEKSSKAEKKKLVHVAQPRRKKERKPPAENNRAAASDYDPLFYAAASLSCCAADPTSRGNCCVVRRAPCVYNRHSFRACATAGQLRTWGLPIVLGLNLAEYKIPRTLKDAHFLSSRLPLPLSNPATGAAAAASQTAEPLPTSPAPDTPSSAEEVLVCSTPVLFSTLLLHAIWF